MLQNLNRTLAIAVPTLLASVEATPAQEFLLSSRWLNFASGPADNIFDYAELANMCQRTLDAHGPPRRAAL